MSHAALRTTSLDVAQALASNLLFHGLSQKAMDQLVRHASVRSMPKGKVLYLQEEDASDIFVIHSGWVKLFRETLDGEEAIIDILTHGHVFGENSLFEGEAYLESAQAVEAVVAIAIPTHIAKALILEESRLALNLLTAMSRHRRHQTLEIEHLTVQNAPQRIGCFLLRLCVGKEAERPITLHLPYDKTLIAARLGMQPETFSRALTKLREQTDIRIQGSTVTIGSIDVLSKFCCGSCSSAFPCEDLTPVHPQAR